MFGIVMRIILSSNLAVIKLQDKGRRFRASLVLAFISITLQLPLPFYQTGLWHLLHRTAPY